MAKTAATDLVTNIIRRMGWPDDASTGRADVLRALNDAYMEILQKHSLLFLQVRTTLTLPTATLLLPAPTSPLIDIGKTCIIGLPSSAGELVYKAPDEFEREPAYTYGAWGNTVPACWTFATDTSGTLQIHFRPGNTSGLSVVYTISYQQVAAELTDGVGATLLPEGYEDTLLTNFAEEKLRRYHGAPGWQELAQRNAADLEAFYEKYRATKERPWTDREQMDRKAYEAQMAPGV